MGVVLLRFKKTYRYNGAIDVEVRDLCDVMNALPGIETLDSCCGHGSSSLGIYFKVTSEKGLFFLTRCVDHRYWKYGSLWGIRILVGDRYKSGGDLPITYLLHSGSVIGEAAYNQAKDLICNLNNHLNNKAFINGYNLDINDFELEDEEMIIKLK